MILVHIKTRLDLLGIQTFRWDQRLQLQNFFMALGMLVHKKNNTRGKEYPIKHGVLEMAIQYSNILPHVMPLGNFITVLFTTCFTLRVIFLIAG